MKSIRNWNAGWRFAKLPWHAVNPAAILPDAEAVSLPHTWYRDNDAYRGDAVYQKRFALRPSETEGKRLFLRFHGVDKICKVYVNGQLVGAHRGAYSIFAADVTDAVQKDGENIVTVLVNNEAGKTVSPLSGDFTDFGGIHRDVELIVTESCHFDLLYYGTDGVLFEGVLEDVERGYVQAAPRVCGNAKSLTIHYEVSDRDGTLVAQMDAAPNETVRLPVHAPMLWNGRKAPHLYQATATLYADGAPVDAVTKRVGFRAISVDADRGFFLNGEHVLLRGVAKHQDTAGVFSAVGKTELDTDMARIEEIGANAIRLSHYQHPQYFVDLCDEKGMLVWAEIPMLRMTENDDLLENAKEQLRELIYQNVHHPSIVMWGLQNEIGLFGEYDFQYERMRELQALAKRLDPRRPTTSANPNNVPHESPLSSITDLLGLNLYFGWYYGEVEDIGAYVDAFHRVNPKVPLSISEYGADCNLQFHSDNPKVKDYTEEFQAWFHEKTYPSLRARPFIWGTFVWNMFDFGSAHRDEGGVKHRNNKGLVTYDRQMRKDAFYYYKAIWSDEAFVHIAGKRYVNRPIGTMTVKVYANAPEVTLVSGERRYSSQSESGVFLFSDVPVALGENPVRAMAGDCADDAIFLGVADPDLSYVFVDPNPGVNVKNWFVDEAERERLFPQGSYTILDTINTLLESPEAMRVIDEARSELGHFIRDMVGSFTLERVLQFRKGLLTEDEIKALNQKLVAIKKPARAE